MTFSWQHQRLVLVLGACLAGYCLDVAVAQEPTTEPLELTAEPVVVTATRTERVPASLPVSVSVVTSQDVKDTPAIGTDDIVRTVPGMNLGSFTNSFTAHPTGNMLGMRGLGPLRALTLVDGVPLNDPFFGYSQWNMVPKETIERVEVVRGGASSLWGNYGMGGVVNIITRNAQPRSLSTSILGGSYGTIRSNVYGSDRINDRFGISANVNYQTTDGYTPQVADQRGAIDRPASNTNTNLQFKADYQSPDFNWYARTNYYDSQGNIGYALADNTQHTVNIATGAKWKLGDQEDLKADVFYLQQDFTTNNPDLVNYPNRNADFLSNLHQVPATDIGGSLQYSRILGGLIQSFQVGTDIRAIQATSNAQLYSAPGALPTLDNSQGRQFFVGVFGQASVVPVRDFELLGSLRMDYYHNYQGKDETTTGGTTNFADQTRVQLNPKLAAKYQLTEPIAVRASVYRAFRAPTLGDLYYTQQAVI